MKKSDLPVGLVLVNLTKLLTEAQVATMSAMKKAKLLYSEFQPTGYFLSQNDSTNTLVIVGRKVGRPSRRITLHQRKLKITDAKIEPESDKTSGVEIDRINSLASFEQVRIHAKQVLYPGVYKITISYKNPSSAVSHSRDFMPSIDEPEAWAKAKLEIKS